MKDNNLDAFIKKETAEFKRAIEEYKKKMTSLASKDLDYQFLEQLVKEVAEEDVEVHITLKDGTKLDIVKTPVVNNKQGMWN